MKRVNPKIHLARVLIRPAYQQAEASDTSLIEEFAGGAAILIDEAIGRNWRIYDRLKPREFFNAGGVPTYSCSS